MIAALFPGQGSQQPGMLREVAALPGGLATLAEATGASGTAEEANDDETLLHSTTFAQRALLIAGVASARALESVGVRLDAVAGHSVGAFAAAVACGALSFSDALAAIAVRGAAMERFETGAFAMAALGGLDEFTVAEIARLASRGCVAAYVANVNASDQIVVAGARAALERTVELALERGARARTLPIGLPAHTRLMAPVAAELATFFGGITMRDGSILYVTAAGGRAVRAAACIRADLVQSVAQPVRWADATQALYERDTRLFVEAIPGTVLADLAARAFPDARSVALSVVGCEAIAVLARRIRGTESRDTT